METKEIHTENLPLSERKLLESAQLMINNSNRLLEISNKLENEICAFKEENLQLIKKKKCCIV